MLMMGNDENLKQSSLKLTKENDIRTKLLLVSLSELNEFKRNKTKINTTLSIDLIAKYESIEIVIENPVEMGNPRRYQSTQNINAQRKSVTSIETPVTPCVKEIERLVQIINKTICSDRKLIKIVDKDNVVKDNLKHQSQLQSQQHMMPNDISSDMLIQMKNACRYLRKLSSTLIARNVFLRNLKKIQSETNELRFNLNNKGKNEMNNAHENSDIIDNTGNTVVLKHRLNSNVQFDFNNEIVLPKRTSHGEKESNNHINRDFHKPNLIQTRKTSSNNIGDQKVMYIHNSVVSKVSKKQSFNLSKQKSLIRIAENYHDIVEENILTECKLF